MLARNGVTKLGVADWLTGQEMFVMIAHDAEMQDLSLLKEPRSDFASPAHQDRDTNFATNVA